MNSWVHLRFDILRFTLYNLYSSPDTVRSSDSEPSQEYDIPNIPGNYFFSQLNETYRETLEDYFAEQKKREQQKVRHKSLTSFMLQKTCDMIEVTPS